MVERPAGIEPAALAWEAAYEGSLPRPLTPQILRRTQSPLNAADRAGGLNTVLAAEGNDRLKPPPKAYIQGTSTAFNPERRTPRNRGSL